MGHPPDIMSFERLVPMGTSNAAPPQIAILVPFEEENFHKDYREFYEAKKNNLFAFIQRFREVWECCQMLDDIWMREVRDLEQQRDVANQVPLMLFFRAHLQIRLAFELGFSGCSSEAWNTIRSAIEFAAHALRPLREPNLISVWLNQNDGADEKKAFEQAFIHRKKDQVFPERHGLETLHWYWKNYSEWGTHSTLAALAKSVTLNRQGVGRSWQVHYLDADESRLARYLPHLVLVAAQIEKQFFGAFASRLQFDNELVGLRAAFENAEKQARQNIITRFRIPPPTLFP